MNEKNKETLSLVIKIIVAVLTGLASALGLASCMAAAGVHGFLANL